MRGTAFFVFLSVAVLAAPVLAQKSAQTQTAEVQKVATPVSGAGAEASPPKPGEQKAEMGVFTTSPMPPAIRKVSVLIESSPSNCDIEIDGVYVGATPVQLSLKEGVHHVKLSREGFLPWARAVKAYHGLYVNPTLVQESTRKHDVTESASAK